MNDISPETIEAADRLERWKACRAKMHEQCHEYSMNRMLQVQDEKTLLNWAVTCLAADRAEREERARTIDAEWCEKNGATLGWRPYAYQWSVGAVCVHVWTEDVVSVWIEGRIVAGVTNRGQLLDLLRVLKGGA